MANNMVTDEDILLKKFKNAGFAKSGYDKDDVDDFLDEVAATVRELNKRNTVLEESKGIVPESTVVVKLKEEKSNLEQKINNLENALSDAQKDDKDSKSKSNELTAKENEISSLKNKISELENKLNNIKNSDQKEISKKELADSKDDSGTVESATNMLSLAQKLHDEYIKNAKEEAKKIVDDADAKAYKTIYDANYQITKNKEQYKTEKVSLEKERNNMKKEIEQLKTFEKDYRARLKKQLEDILKNVNNNIE